MLKTVSGLTALSLTLIATALPAAAEARTRGFSGTFHGANGGSAVVQHSVDRQRGSRDATTSVQGANGHGYQTDRSAQWGDGQYQGSKETTLNNGKSFGRETSASANGNGSADFSSTFTGPEGKTKTVTGTVTRQH
jgi:hypothetical protein